MQNTNLVPLVVADIAIRQDSHGRYCLNDLHKAAGEEQRHQPRYWLSNKQTTELVDELGDSGKALSVVRGGPGQGTYVVKQLVYAYAMWISPKFHLQVIRAYDALVTTGLQSVESLSPAVARQIGGMVKAVVHKEVTEALSQSLPSLIHGDVIRDIRVMLDGLGDDADLRHVRETKLVRSYQSDLEEFGGVTFEMEPFETAGGTQQREVAILNEQQSTLLLTYMRNSEIELAFRFFKAKRCVSSKRH